MVGVCSSSLNVYFYFLTVPAAVRDLLLSDAGTRDLNVTWSPAPGDVDHYEVCLIY